MAYIDRLEILDSTLRAGALLMETNFHMFIEDPNKIVEAYETYKKLAVYVDGLATEKNKKLDEDSVYVIADRTNNAVIPQLEVLKKAAESVEKGESDLPPANVFNANSDEGPMVSPIQ